MSAAARRCPQSFREALGEAFGHGSYVLLVLGFFTCGFHVAFITTHLPPYLVDKGLDAKWGGWVIALHRPVQHHRLDHGRRARQQAAEALSALDDLFPRARSPSRAFLLVPMTPASALIVRRRDGRAVALDRAAHLRSRRADVRHALHGDAVRLRVLLATRSASFIGVWLGGFLYERTGSYDVVWWLGVALGIFAALVHLPIREQPVERLAAAPA